MELGGYGFEKTELVKLAEEIYALKSRKKHVELKLHSESFHYQYISKRKEMVLHEVTFRLIFIIPLTILVVAALGGIIYMLLQPSKLVGNGPAGVAMLGCALLAAFGGYGAVKLWIRELRMLILLKISANPEKAVRFARKYEINTFQSDEELTQKRMDMLKGEIENIEQKISELEQKQAGIIERKRQEEKLLRDKGILFDKHPDDTKGEGLVLRKSSMGEQDIWELHEMYCREEQYILKCMQEMDTDIQLVNKQITKIDDDFEEVKKIFLISGIGYILLILIQSAFTGNLQMLTSILCFAGSMIYIFYLERKCKQPILLYLVEHDSQLTSEYAFCNDMVPFYSKRRELLIVKEQYQKELMDVRKQKEELDL